MIHSRQIARTCMAMVAVAGLLLSSLVAPGAQALTPKTAPAGPAATQIAQEESDAYRREPGAGAMILDGLLVRPVAFAATLVGGAVYLVTLPFSALGGNAGQAGKTLVVQPAQYTFTRCLGCFREWP